MTPLPPASTGVRTQVALLAALALALGLYSVTFSFVWDDPFVIELNPAVTGDLSSGRVLESALVLKNGPTAFYRPLQLLSHALEFRVFGLGPWGYHLTSALLHAGVVVLVFLCGLALAPVRGAFAGAALFALHPVHAEPVSFVSSRGDLLSALFMLLAFRFAIGAVGAKERRALAGFAAAAGLATLLSLLSKESALLVPLALLVWVLGRPEGETALPRRRVATAVAVGLGAGLAVYAVVRLATVPGPPLPAGEGFDPGGALRRLVVYLRLLVDPTAIKVWWSPRAVGWGPGSLAGAVALAGLIAAAVAPGTRRRDRAFLCCWFLLALAPALKIVNFPGADLAARYLYLPSAALSWGLAALWPTPGPHPDRARFARMAAAVAAVALASLWYREASSWRGEMSLYARMVREEPSSESARYNLANTLYKAGRREEAIAQLAVAVQLNPGYPSARYNLGRYLAELGRGAEAVEHFEAYLRLRPNAPDADFTRAFLRRLQLGQP